MWRHACLRGDDDDDFLYTATTHLVTQPKARHGRATKIAKRTLKYFAALLRGNWVLSFDWCVVSFVLR